MSTLSREAARACIQKIREENGGISLEDRQATPPAVLRSLDNIRRKLGAATKTLATNLYSKDTRFVYELIQNAEDNSYTRAEADGTDLYLCFSLYPDKIVLDSNEDGFCEDHVRAICSTGESTKTISQGFIGEKGIGFKSVFKVAKKVHIQSGPFSFSFEHRKDSFDDGLGMVTPLDEDFHDLPEGINTRITLTLLDPSSFEQRAYDLFNLPDTLLLFLTKLNVLHFKIYPQTGGATETKFSLFVSDGDDTLETITKTTTTDGKSTRQDHRFWVIRKCIKNLSPDAARPCTNQATVVLAFPVEVDNSAVIKEQLVYAFLPLRNVGFTFLIQSDFITQASREDVFHCKRNIELLSGVAEAFRDAVLHFCSHPVLRYQWMRYLPSESVSDEFWKKLRPLILSLLRETRILLPWSESSLFLPSQLYLIPANFKDEHGMPLFADSEKEEYLSPNYTLEDFKILSLLGARQMSLNNLIERVRSDLKTADPKMWAVNPINEDWHVRVAKLLLRKSSRNADWYNEAVKSLELIPLPRRKALFGDSLLFPPGGTKDIWVSAEKMPIYFPNTGKIPIPRDLELTLVNPTATSNDARRAFFSHLGVVAARTSDIVSLISKRYSTWALCTLEDNIAHLRYLYWNLPKDIPDLDKNIPLLDKGKNAVYRSKDRREHLYFEEKEEDWGALQLLESGPLEKPDAPGLRVRFLNAKYFDAVPAEAIHHGRSWKQWLAEFAGVQSYPQLQNARDGSLSDEFKYIIKHRSEKLIGLMKNYWSSYETDMQSSPALVRKLKRSWVHSDADLAKNLQSTTLPLPRLKEMVERLKIVDFPFLVMSEQLTDENEDEWQFLSLFGVGTTDDLHFYVNALKRIAHENQHGCSPDSLDALFKVYAALERNCSSPDDSKDIREIFQSLEMIYIPASEVAGARWVSSEACVWIAPKWLKTKQRLAGVARFETCDHLFRNILRIGDVNWEDFLNELKVLKVQTCVSTERVVDIYQLLYREFEGDSSGTYLRTLFETSQLVYLPSRDTWHPPSSCIWAGDQVQIPEKAPIRTPYRHLKRFFCDVLDVPKPDVKMYIQGLITLAASRPPLLESKIKQMIMLISSMDPSADDVAELQSANIFSVAKTNGQKTFTNCSGGFAIIDRIEYGSAFSGKISMLDYSIKEVNDCKSVFQSLGMRKKYLSELVDETTSVDGGAIDTEMTRAFRMKAYALIRCTAHYRSKKSQRGNESLYDQLRNASIYVSNGITKSISVVQYGERIIVEGNRANLHIDKDDGLRLYVPREENARQECLFSQLPRRLMTFLDISDPEAESLLNGVINCGSLIAVDGILKNAGIIEIDGMARSLDGDERTHPSDREDVSPKHSTQASDEDAINTSAETQTPSDVGLASGSITSTVGTARTLGEHLADMPRMSPGFVGQNFEPREESVYSTPTVFITDSDTGYASLLERLIESAGRMSIPARGSHSLDNLRSMASPDHALYFPSYGPRSVERDRKIGAAGELLVFEILTQLDLFGFTEDNWKSTIRKEIRVHDKYRSLEPWQGRETADITYDDTNGHFTKLLIEKGYLANETWENERPTYYLEVKTTRKAYDEQFYMSGSQYNRMQRMKIPQQSAAPSVYIILRVFDLEGEIGLQLYVDPETSRLEGELNFKVDTWAVKHAAV